MQFITAFLFLLSALGLYYMSRSIQGDDEDASLVLPGISITILLVSVTLLVGRTLGTPTGIEDLFLKSNDTATTGWPSFPALLIFSLVGVVGVISLFPGRLRDRSFIYAGGFIFAVGLVAVIGYVLNMPVLYYDINTFCRLCLCRALSYLCCSDLA
jgi:hypothetical protein